MVRDPDERIPDSIFIFVSCLNLYDLGIMERDRMMFVMQMLLDTISRGRRESRQHQAPKASQCDRDKSLNLSFSPSCHNTCVHKIGQR